MSMDTSTPIPDVTHDGAYAFAQAMIAYSKAVRGIADTVGGLPRLPAYDPPAEADRDAGWEWDFECRDHDLMVTTVDLAQSCRFDPEEMIASTDGWDDMGDMDGPQYIHCYDCGKNYAVPDDMNWS